MPMSDIHNSWRSISGFFKSFDSTPSFIKPESHLTQIELHYSHQYVNKAIKLSPCSGEIHPIKLIHNTAGEK